MNWKLSLDELQRAVDGFSVCVKEKEFHGVGTDTRKSLKHEIFFALKGDQFDGHNYLSQAVEQGAAVLVVHQDIPLESALRQQVSVVQVADTLRALQSLGLYWRRRNKFKVIGITGSNGKTTTKMFTRTLLGEKFPTWAAEGSLNNHWGVPISLLQADEDIRIVVQEMGMNHAGEITALCKMAEPDIVGVTMVGRAHIGELGSQEAIARAKEEIYLASPEAMYIFNLDNPWTKKMYDARAALLPWSRWLTFSQQNSEADIFLRCENSSIEGLQVQGHIMGHVGRAQVPVIGEHNLTNLMAACTFACAAGAPPQSLWSLMAQCHTGWGRNQLLRLKSGARVLFDGYNANPESMEALFKNCRQWSLKGRKVFVLGEMLELGAEAEKAHEQIGELAAELAPDAVWFIGPHGAQFAAGLKRRGFAKKQVISDNYEESLALELGSMLSADDIAIVKGSRGMKLERVVQAWEPATEFSKS